MTVRVGHPVLYQSLVGPKLLLKHQSYLLSEVSHDFLKFFGAHHLSGPLHLILTEFSWKLSMLKIEKNYWLMTVRHFFRLSSSVEITAASENCNRKTTPLQSTYLFLFLKPIKHLTICLLNQSLINFVPVSPSMLIELLLEHLLLHVVV